MRLIYMIGVISGVDGGWWLLSLGRNHLGWSGKSCNLRWIYVFGTPIDCFSDTMLQVIEWNGVDVILLKTAVFIFFFDIFFKNIHYIQKIFTFEEIIFSLERCIVKKKTYLCIVRLEKWLDDKKAFFALSWNRNRQFQSKGIETIATLILYICI